jgi:hypothetical protein
LLQAHLRKDREKIIDQLERNVPVENGVRRVKLSVQKSRRLTADKLLPLIGKQEVERLKSLVQPTISLSLKIE